MMRKHSRCTLIIYTVLLLLLSSVGSAVIPVQANELEYIGSTTEKMVSVNAGELTTLLPPELRMNVKEVGAVSASFCVQDPHLWIIRGGIPSDIGESIHYKITQTLDPCLTYEKFSLSVKVVTPAGEEYPLKAREHYIVTEQCTTQDANTREELMVSLTQQGSAYIASLLKGDESGAELRVRYRASINKNAEMGSQIVGQSQLEYTSAAGECYRIASDKAAVYTGGAHVRMIDTQEQPLEGISFMIARAATEQECSDWSVAKELLDTGDQPVAVIYEDFFDSMDMSGEKTFEVTTDEQGIAEIYGLSYGTYYLVEAAAPSGYNLTGKPKLIEINEISHLTKWDGWKNSKNQTVDNTITVITTKTALPETGGYGTAAISAVGVLVIVSAGILLIMNHRKPL